MPRTRLALCLTLALCVPALADAVHLKDGAVLTGRIVSRSAKEVVIETDDLGRVPVPMAEVVRIQKDGAPETTPAGEESTDEAAGEEAGEPEEPEATPGRLSGRHRAFRLVKKKRPKVVEPDPTKIPEPDKPSPEKDPTKDPGTDAPAADTPPGPEVAAPTPVPPEDGGLDLPEIDEQEHRGLDGTVLADLAKGTTVIVFEAPRQFDAAPAAVEIGKRTVAQIDMVGVATAWFTMDMKEAVRRIPVRLVDVKRHVVVQSSASRTRILEGISPGDWIRVLLRDGTRTEGRLASYRSGSIKLFTKTITEGGVRTDEQSVSILDVVELDGMHRNTVAMNSVTELTTGEPVAVVYWPQGDEIIGRVAKVDSGVVSVDTDGDGAADARFHRDGAIAEVQRVPVRYVRLAKDLRPGQFLRCASTEEFDDVVVQQEHRGVIAGVTAYAVSLETPKGAVVVPFEEMSEIAPLDDAEQRAILRGDEVDPATLRSDLKILPGAPAEVADDIDPASGISAITDGRVVTHVFVAVPFAGEVFGLKLGDTAVSAARDSGIRFDTQVTSRIAPGVTEQPAEFISEAVRGMTVTLVVNQRGRIANIELTAR